MLLCRCPRFESGCNVTCELVNLTRIVTESKFDLSSSISFRLLADSGLSLQLTFLSCNPSLMTLCIYIQTPTLLIIFMNLQLHTTPNAIFTGPFPICTSYLQN